MLVKYHMVQCISINCVKSRIHGSPPGLLHSLQHVFCRVGVELVDGFPNRDGCCVRAPFKVGGDESVSSGLIIII